MEGPRFGCRRRKCTHYAVMTTVTGSPAKPRNVA